MKQICQNPKGIPSDQWAMSSVPSIIVNSLGAFSWSKSFNILALQKRTFLSYTTPCSKQEIKENEMFSYKPSQVTCTLYQCLFVCGVLESRWKELCTIYCNKITVFSSSNQSLNS